MNETVEEIEKYISWLDQNSNSNNLTQISQVLGKMSTQCYYFSKLVSDAYELQAEAEDIYKELKAAFIKNSLEGVTKAQAIVEADESVKEARRSYTKANAIYVGLKNHSHQFETIMDCVRQRISVEKSLNTKGI